MNFQQPDQIHMQAIRHAQTPAARLLRPRRGGNDPSIAGLAGVPPISPGEEPIRPASCATTRQEAQAGTLPPRWPPTPTAASMPRGRVRASDRR